MTEPRVISLAAVAAREMRYRELIIKAYAEGFRTGRSFDPDCDDGDGWYESSAQLELSLIAPWKDPHD